jgi:hypothetical protein
VDDVEWTDPYSLWIWSSFLTFCLSMWLRVSCPLWLTPRVILCLLWLSGGWPSVCPWRVFLVAVVVDRMVDRVAKPCDYPYCSPWILRWAVRYRYLFFVNCLIPVGCCYYALLFMRIIFMIIMMRVIRHHPSNLVGPVRDPCESEDSGDTRWYIKMKLIPYLPVFNRWAANFN